eukprot:5654864-Alexandrium_andersonii.AAC.1
MKQKPCRPHAPEDPRGVTWRCAAGCDEPRPFSSTVAQVASAGVQGSQGAYQRGRHPPRSRRAQAA